MQQAVYRRVQPCSTLPPQSLLAQHASRYTNAYCDCFELHVVTAPSEPRAQTTASNVANATISMSFAESFFTSPAFQLEAIVLRTGRIILSSTMLGRQQPSPPIDQGKGTTTDPSKREAFGSGFFRVRDKTSNEIVLDSGNFLTWLQVTTEPQPPQRVDKRNNGSSTNSNGLPRKQQICYRMGTICKQPNFLVHLFTRPHQWYSKLLLSSAVQHHIITTTTSTATKPITKL